MSNLVRVCELKFECYFIQHLTFQCQVMLLQRLTMNQQYITNVTAEDGTAHMR